MVNAVSNNQTHSYVLNTSNSSKEKFINLLFKYSGGAPIIGAVLANDNEAINIMLDHGVTINSPSDTCSPLKRALIANNQQMAMFLIDKGHIIDRMAAANEVEPIYLVIYACGYNPQNIEILRKLLDKGVDPNKRASRNVDFPSVIYYNNQYSAGKNALEYTSLIIAGMQAHNNSNPHNKRPVEIYKEVLSLLVAHGAHF